MFFTKIINFSLAYKLKHSFKDKPVIDYDIATMFSPALFLGSFLGVLANSALSYIITILVYCCIMCISIFYCTKTAMNIRRKELI